MNSTNKNATSLYHWQETTVWDLFRQNWTLTPLQCAQ